MLGSCSPGLYQQGAGLNYQFGPETGLNYALQANKDSLRIILKVTDETAISYLQKTDTHLPYLLSRDYDRKSVYLRDSILFLNKKMQDMPDKAALFTFAIAVNKITFPSVLILQIPQSSATQEELLLDIPLTAKSKCQAFRLADSTGQVPLFQNFINSNQSFTILSREADTLVTIRQFPATFAPAIPPMSGKAPAAQPATLKAQYKEAVPITQPLQLAQPGIYLLENNGANTSLLVEEGVFPELTSAKELIEPLIYLTSSAERKSLYDAPNPKLAVDAFWLNIAQQDKNLGKTLIREFYERVEKANRYFSAHKAGWLTDRGMIYLVFGAPAFLNKTWNQEEWIYQQNNGPSDQVKFIFIKKPNTFTENHYELVRDGAYEYVWYNQVDQWRKGTIGILVPGPAPSGKRSRTK